MRLTTIYDGAGKVIARLEYADEPKRPAPTPRLPPRLDPVSVEARRLRYQEYLEAVRGAEESYHPLEGEDRAAGLERIKATLAKAYLL